MIMIWESLAFYLNFKNLSKFGKTKMKTYFKEISLENTIEFLKEKLKNLKNLNETETRTILINPLLCGLGFYPDLPNLVKEEASVQNVGNADYCLLGKEKIYVEAKPFGKKFTEKEITQVLNYVNAKGFSWCILTDGNNYQIFDNSIQAGALEKLVFEFKISENGVDEICEILQFFTQVNFPSTELKKKKGQFLLWRKIEEINQEKYIRFNYENGFKTHILEIPQLKEIIKDEETLDFLFEKISLEKEEDLEKREAEVWHSLDEDFSFKKVSKLRFENEVFEIKAWKEVLINIVEQLIKKDPQKFNSLRNKKYFQTKLFDSEIEAFKGSRGSRQLRNKIWLLTDLSANELIKVSRRFLKEFNISKRLVKIKTKEMDSPLQKIDSFWYSFAQEFSFEGKKPLIVEIENEKIEVITWRNVMTKTLEFLIKKDSKIIENLRDKRGFYLYSQIPPDTKYPKDFFRLSNGLYFTIHLRSSNIIRVFRKYFREFNIPESSVKILLKD